MKASGLICILFLVFFSFTFSGLQPSIAQGTLVKTSRGFITIEELKKEDKVSIVSNHHENTELSIISILPSVVEQSVCVETPDEKIYVSKDQLFFDFVSEKWVEAQNLSVANIFLNAEGEPVPCLGIEHKTQETILYEVTLEDPHVFYLTKSAILSHNFAPAIVFTLSFSFGSGGVTFAGISAGVVAFGMWLGSVIGGNKERPVTFHFKESNKVDPFRNKETSGGGGGSNKDPKKKDNKEKLDEFARRELARRWLEKVKKKWKETKDYLFNSHGEKVYQRGRKQITFDKDGHKGGIWKMFKAGTDHRLGTYNENLTKLIGG